MSLAVIMQIFTALPEVIKAIQSIANSDAAHTIESAVKEFIDHISPGQPNSPTLS